jgi:sialate O-acetylesterase
MTSISLYLVSHMAAASFNLSNTLGDHMVLQRAPQSALLWGFGEPGLLVQTTLFGLPLGPAKVGTDRIWRQTLPPTPASSTPTTISLNGSDGTTVLLSDVLFGDVFICGGQSNMQYTPKSMAGMNNMSAEIAAADALGERIRLFTVGMDTVCGDPAKPGHTDCSRPFRQLNTDIPSAGQPCRSGHSCREPWTRASASAFGGAAWDTYSAVCFLTSKYIFETLGGGVPLGLVSSNWGGTPIQVWQPQESAADCGGASGGVLYNSMIAPFALGPMALTGVTWYQGENNVNSPGYYECAFPSMITRWREAFRAPRLWFGFVQIAGWRYSVPYGNPPRPEVDHSRRAGDLRQAQLSALRLAHVGMTSAIDTGDWVNIHPPDKQTPSHRLANQALAQIYGLALGATDFPLYAGVRSVKRVRSAEHSLTLPTGTTTISVEVSILAGGEAVELTTKPPPPATRSTTLGKGPDLARHLCVTSQPAFGLTFPEDCGYPSLVGINTSTNATLYLNASAVVGGDGSSLVLSAEAPSDFGLTATSYGRASWPMTRFWSKVGQLPVIPWHAAIDALDAYSLPPKTAEERKQDQEEAAHAAGGDLDQRLRDELQAIGLDGLYSYDWSGE